MTQVLRRRVLLLAFAPAVLPLALPSPGGARAQGAPPPAGPKKRLAVASFQSMGAFQTALGGADVGGVLADQLSTVLAQSGLFDVVDRADVNMVLKEQSLAPKSATQGEAADSPADLLGAQVIVRGTVTTFEPNAGGGGLSLGVSAGPLNSLLGQHSQKAAIGMDIRLVDTTTGRILGAFHVQDVAVSKTIAVGLSGPSGANLTQSAFSNTPLGQATQKIFAKAVPEISARLREVTWTGRIADVSGQDVFLNVGLQNGVAVGDTFAVSRIARRIVDPASGEFLGVSETPVGQVKVIEVQDRFSKVLPVTPLALQRGDVARYLH